ncbi:hypothetical protein EVA_15275 [gut metagenome]|uniref:Uncharacterized protein n=1 Tax=gut metagenome TaxID=749906 RepID=J9GB31_9ZZZZ
MAASFFGDADNNEYIYLPGGEVGTENPLCVVEREGSKEDLSVEAASDLVLHLSLRPCTHPILGKRSY